MELIEARRLAAVAFAAELEGDSESRTLELSRLISDEGPARVADMAACLGRSLASERSLAGHALRQIYEVAPSDNVVHQILEILDGEREPAVVAPFLTALGWVCRTEPVGSAWRSEISAKLLEYEADPSPLVRYAVSDVLSSFAPGASASAGLARLARDEDEDVRWSAVFELSAWISEIPDVQISALLAEISVTDRNDEIRAQAAEGLAEAAGPNDGGEVA